jgi:Flp pilus assembly protein TadG
MSRPIRSRDERGVAAVWTLLSAAGVFVLLLGLVFDGGSVIDARLEAKRAAEQAARAGADELRGARSGVEGVDADAAAARAQEMLRRAGWSGTVHVQGTRVHVTATGAEPTVFLGVLGIDRLPVGETGTATAVTGPP